MWRRWSARSLLTTVTLAFTTVLIFLLISVVRQSLAGTNPAAIDDAAAAAWTVGSLFIILAGFNAWLLGGYLFTPLWNLRRDLALNARSRAIAEPYHGEHEEVRALREMLIRMLREMEETARKTETEKRRVLDLIEDVSEGIAQIGSDGRFTRVNRAARRLLSLPPQPEGQSASTLVRNQELRDIITRAAEGQQQAASEVIVDNRHLLVAPQTSSEIGRDDGAVITVMDFTELRRLESVRRDFVANVSHELKTPLTSIRGYAETLLSHDVDRDDQLRFLEIIHRNATRLQQMVEELLDLARLESGGWIPTLEDVDIATAAREAWSSCEEGAARKRVRLIVNGEAIRARADASAMQQVFSNLLDNALRYTPEDGCISVTTRFHGIRVVTEVADTGSGIPAAALPRIFERFYRVDAARSRAAGGTGLGLAIVKHLVEQLNGQVSVRSTLGAGTTVTIELPAADRE